MTITHQTIPISDDAVRAEAATVTEWTTWSDRRKNGVHIRYDRGISTSGLAVHRRYIDGQLEHVALVTTERTIWVTP